MVVQKQQHSPRERRPQHKATSRTDFKNTRTYTDEEGIPSGEAPTSYGCGFLQLGSGPTITHQVWVANIEMAISIAKVAWRNFCLQEFIKALCTPQHDKPQYQEQTQICPPSLHATSPTQNMTKRPMPGSLSHIDHLSKLQYHRNQAVNRTNTPAHSLVLYPIFTPPPSIPKDKGPRHTYPAATPSKTLRPYDRIGTHLRRLHTWIKTPQVIFRVVEIT
jgi:hypothetical protein